MTQYKYFPKYILRTPLLSIDNYLDLTDKTNLDLNKLKEYLLLPEVKEAIFLASPEFYKEVIKSIDTDSIDSNLILSIFKYISRMCSRPTPFGLFAGCSIGSIDTSTSISINNSDSNKRKTRLDMHFLYSLGKSLIGNPILQSELKFYPNETLYQINDKYRYVECLINDGERKHELSSIKASIYVQKVLEKAALGERIDVLAKEIVEEDISFDDAKSFVKELILNQVLLSELEPSVSGDEYLEQIISKLKNKNNAKSILTDLKKVQEKLKILDRKVGIPITEYNDIKDELQKFETSIDDKFLFQCDMETNVLKNTLDKKIAYSIIDTLKVLKGIDTIYENPVLNKFKNDFIKRYGDEEVSLAKVLDVEQGIGYGSEPESFITTDLLKNIDLPLKRNNESQRNINLNAFQNFLFNKILEAAPNKEKIIRLQKNEINEYKRDLNNLPPTITALVELISEKNQQKAVLTVIGGESGANILTRFCYLNDDIKKHVKDIIEIEKNINTDIVTAEVTHLPQSRTGNVVMKPQFRDYEIPYLSNCVLNNENKLTIDDLFISIDSQRELKLRSKRLNKEVKPYLTHAHNYISNALTVYRFFGDLQHMGRKFILGSNFKSLYDNTPFIPRIEYNNIIISKATWNFRKDDFSSLKANISDDEKLIKSLEEFKENFKVNELMLLIEGDNELLINLNNLTSVRMWLKTIKNRGKVTMQEFLYDKDRLAYKGDVYSNQFILSFYKSTQETFS